jgi:predicted aspartyl protease
LSTFSIKATVVNLTAPERRTSTELLVDTGAVYSMLPRPVLVSLGITPRSRRQFRLRDGRTVVWEFGNALFVVDGYQAPSPVIFGEENCPQLLGAVTREAMGVGVDPVNKQLIPIEGLLASPH